MWHLSLFKTHMYLLHLTSLYYSTTRSIIMQNCRDRMDYIRGLIFPYFWRLVRYTIERSVRGHNGPTHVPDSCLFPPRSAPMGGQSKSAEPIEMTDSCALKELLVRWAHWRHLVNTIEPSALPAKKQQRVQVQQRVHATIVPIPLSRADALEHYIKFSSIKIPFRCGLSSKVFDD